MDKENTSLLNGKPVTPGYDEIEPDTGLQHNYLVLTEEERAKGFVRPLRYAYIHKTCHTLTSINKEIAETYARNPKFYSGTYCCQCKGHFPVSEFIWHNTDEEVGS